MLCGLFSSDALALGGRLNNPVISIPKRPRPGDGVRLNLAAPDRHRTLLFEDFKEAFISGYFINSVSRLYFEGDAATLNQMLAELDEAEEATYGVRFVRRPIDVVEPFKGAETVFKKRVGVAGWRIDHDGMGGRLTITIHAGGGGIDVEKLELPAMNGRKGSVATGVVTGVDLKIKR